MADTVSHTVMECNKWAEERGKCFRKLGIRTGSESMKELWERSTRDTDSWHVFRGMCKEILLKKAEEERRREKEGLDCGRSDPSEADSEWGREDTD